MKYCDLHCHSTCSDGTYTPGELIDLACAAGLGAIALTDHNTVSGNRAFLEAAKGRIEACGGCEFTTESDGQELHLLGLFPESADLIAVRKVLAEQRNRKEESNRLTIERLAAAGYDLSYDEFISLYGNGSKNRVHIARYMMSKGIVATVDEAFKGLLSSEGGYYRESAKLDFYSMISLIAEAGGVSVWAHPLFHVPDRTACESILRRAKACGLDGVEVYYSTYTEEDTAFMLEMSEKYRLLQSGGSDFHGANKENISLGTGCGNLRIPYEFYRRLMERMRENRAEP